MSKQRVETGEQRVGTGRQRGGGRERRERETERRRSLTFHVKHNKVKVLRVAVALKVLIPLSTPHEEVV